MPAPEAIPAIARHLLRYNHQSKIPFPTSFQTTAKSLYHQTSAQASAQMQTQMRSGMGAGVGEGAGAHASISARIAASKGDRERILKSIERARVGRPVRGGRVWEEQIYPPIVGWLV